MAIIKKWWNLPLEMTATELQKRLLRDDLIFFYGGENLERFLVLPYEVIERDIYGRPFLVKPKIYSNGKQVKEILDLELECKYVLILDEDVDYETIMKSGILLNVNMTHEEKRNFCTIANSIWDLGVWYDEYIVNEKKGVKISIDEILDNSWDLEKVEKKSEKNK